MINKSNIGEVSIEQKDFKVTIKQKEENITQVLSAPMAMQSAAYAPQPAISGSAQQASLPSMSAPEKSKPAESSAANLVTIKSPMIGTFYRSASPGKPQFVQVGDEVAPGKVVCIIEAMKLFNEIESDISGRIVKVLVENSSPVEYDQPLFLIDPA